VEYPLSNVRDDEDTLWKSQPSLEKCSSGIEKDFTIEDTSTGEK